MKTSAKTIGAVQSRELGGMLNYYLSRSCLMRTAKCLSMTVVSRLLWIALFPDCLEVRFRSNSRDLARRQRLRLFPGIVVFRCTCPAFTEHSSFWTYEVGRSSTRRDLLEFGAAPGLEKGKTQNHLNC